MKRLHFLVGILIVTCLLAVVLSDTSFVSSPTGGAVVCNMPMIRHGSGCCLDSDHNRICDGDEGLVKKVLDKEELGRYRLS